MSESNPNVIIIVAEDSLSITNGGENLLLDVIKSAEVVATAIKREYSIDVSLTSFIALGADENNIYVSNLFELYVLAEFNIEADEWQIFTRCKQPE